MIQSDQHMLQMGGKKPTNWNIISFMLFCLVGWAMVWTHWMSYGLSRLKWLQGCWWPFSGRLSMVPLHWGDFFNSNQAVPVKHLPPGQLSDLWWQFSSWHEARKKQGLPSDEEPPSWASFYRCWVDRWYKRALVFRRTSQHAECDFCWKKRTEMATQKLSPAERIKIASEWRQHLVLQYEDRCIYWSLRFASRAKLNVLCIIADSMGKVRWAYPKYAYHRCDCQETGVGRWICAVTLRFLPSGSA